MSGHGTSQVCRVYAFVRHTTRARAHISRARARERDDTLRHTEPHGAPNKRHALSARETHISFKYTSFSLFTEFAHTRHGRA